MVFKLEEGYGDMPVSIPCGRCSGCRLEKCRQWAMRCMHEASLHEENSFITLTYDDAHLPVGGSLRFVDFQKFMKRLRRRYDDRRIRFFHSGEYGGRTGRPHYHALLFGFDFGDKVYWTSRQGHRVYRSPELEELWRFGQSEIGSVTFDSAAYVARYIQKKRDGEKFADHYLGVVEDTGEVVELAREYSTMSRNPGIGREWYERYKKGVYAHDSVLVRGLELRPPRYYDGLYEVENPRKLKALKRRRAAARNPEEERGSRMLARKEVSEARSNLHSGGAL